jgi:uncharacterized protein
MPRVVHFDIAVADPARAIAFYSQIFGWKITRATGPLEYWLIRTGEEDMPGIDGGLARREADWQRITMFVDVESADSVSAEVAKAGGRIVQPQTTIPGVGYVVACEDTEGNTFAVIQQDETAGF